MDVDEVNVQQDTKILGVCMCIVQDSEMHKLANCSREYIKVKEEYRHMNFTGHAMLTVQRETLNYHWSYML